MNSKTLVIVIFLLILSLLTNLYLIATKTSSPKSVNLSNSFSSNPSPVNFPIDPKIKGIQSASATYEFNGKVLKLDEVNKNTRITLDISNSQIPDFLITKNTFIIDNDTSSKATKEDIKVGSDVTITMTYFLNQKIWELTSVLILNSTK